MSAARRLPRISLLLGAASFSIAAVSKESFRDRIAKTLGINVPGGIWRLLAIIFGLMNLKNLPWVWHYRLFRALIYHLFLQPTDIKPQDLFKPVIQTTHTPVAETDYNLHKSNSTYFTDLDIARTHLATAILRKGIRGIGTKTENKNETFSFMNTSRAAGHKEKKRRGSSNINPLGTSGVVTEGPKVMSEEEWFKQDSQPGALLIALGAVTCHFHREIAPYRQYEIWTRLMTWDRKWLYIVSHFVEAGTFKPSGYALQPWTKRNTRQVQNLTADDKVKLKRKVFASSVAKYVVKKGRLTIPPELVLERSGMLPPRPEGTPILGGWTPGPSTSGTPDMTTSPSPGPESETTTAVESSGESSDVLPEDPRQRVLEESLFPSSTGEDGDGWTWDRVQAQRLKGLKLAEAFDMLDGLKDVFPLEGEESLGRYTDLIFSF